MKKIIIISGPTACGKTKTAVGFCKKHNGEIISCDSRQVYKYLDIGSNKEGIFIESGTREIDGIRQYLTDIIEPDLRYSAADFIRDAKTKIELIIKKGKLPVIVGGTGLYIKALLYGIDKMPCADDNLRKSLSAKSKIQLYEELLKLDKTAAQKNKDNPQRLLRALEINMLSGKTLEEHYKPKKALFDFQHFSIKSDLKILYSVINTRCRFMIENGMIEETKKVLDMGFKKDCPALSAIGYRLIVKFLNNEISKEVLIEEISKDTRHYAKRQNTWFKAQKEVQFINLGAI